MDNSTNSLSNENEGTRSDDTQELEVVYVHASEIATDPSDFAPEPPWGDYPPGCEEAVSVGCTCPVSDNSNGSGFIIDGNRFYFINTSCPIHGVPPEPEEEDV